MDLRTLHSLLTTILTGQIHICQIFLYCVSCDVTNPPIEKLDVEDCLAIWPNPAAMLFLQSITTGQPDCHIFFLVRRSNFDQNIQDVYDLL